MPSWGTRRIAILAKKLIDWDPGVEREVWGFSSDRVHPMSHRVIGVGRKRARAGSPCFGSVCLAWYFVYVRARASGYLCCRCRVKPKRSMWHVASEAPSPYYRTTGSWLVFATEPRLSYSRCLGSKSLYLQACRQVRRFASPTLAQSIRSSMAFLHRGP